MKDLIKTLIICIMAVLIFVGAARLEDNSHYYTETCVVNHVYYDDVVFKTSDGNLFAWSLDADDYMYRIGDTYKLRLYDNGTSVVYDDEIKEVIYVPNKVQ